MAFLYKRLVCVILVFSLMLGVTASMFAVAESSVYIKFRRFESGEGSATQEGACSAGSTKHRLEGKTAVMFEQNTDRNGDIHWYIYGPSSAGSTGTDITGATHIAFDIYINDPSLWSVNSSDCSIAVRSVGSSGWDSSCTRVSSTNLYNAFSALEAGWSHIVLPLEEIKRPDVYALKIFFYGYVKQGFLAVIDDMRFVNQAYLDSDEYADSLTAKSVAIMIDALDEESSADELSSVREAVDALTEAQKKMLSNLDCLKALEAGKPLPGNEKKTFTDVPESHLAERQNDPGEFSIALLSDLHYAVNYNGQQQHTYYNSAQWIVDNAEKENIKMTVQLGDMTSYNALYQWRIFRNGMDILKENGIPYTAVVGNHDVGNGKNKLSFNTFLPYSEQLEFNTYFAGSRSEKQVEDSYYCFTVSGVNYMILTVGVYPDENEIKWADGVIKAHPEHNVIIVTHAHLMQIGKNVAYTQETEALAAGYKGVSLWEGAMKSNPNVVMAVCAHNTYNTNKVGLLEDKNDEGMPVYQFLVSDPQGYEATYGGMGFVCLLKFKNKGKTVETEYISTRFDKNFGTDSNYTAELSTVYTQSGLKLMAKETDDLIKSIGTVDVSKLELIEKASAEVYSLPYFAKKLLENEAELKVAEKTVSLLRWAVKLPEVGLATAADVANIKSAAAELEKLSDEEKAVVSSELVQTIADLVEEIKGIAGYGDMDGSGAVTASDALAVLQAAVGKIALTDKEKLIADVDDNGTVTAGDALFVLQKAVGKIDIFPVEKAE